MAAADEKVTFGATIESGPDRAAAPHVLRPAPSHASSLARAPDPAANPLSAFYKHPHARRSMDGLAAGAGAGALLTPAPAPTPSASKTHLDVFAGDLEAGAGLSATTTTTAPASGSAHKVSVDGRVHECTMWPSQKDLLARRAAHQRAKGCNLFRRLTARQRLYAKIVVALVVVALAVGLGVGISRAVGGGVWSGNGQSRQIPNN